MDSNCEECGQRPAVAPQQEAPTDREESGSGQHVDGPSDSPVVGTWARFAPGRSGLEVTGGEESVLRYVEGANGPLDEGFVPCIPTAAELVEAIKYWYRKVLYIDWCSFVNGGTGSREMRTKRYAVACINQAVEAVGQDAADRAIMDVNGEFRAEVKNDRLWEIFTNGTKEQWDAVQDETCRGFIEHDAAEALERLDRLEKDPRGGIVAVVLRDFPSDKGKPVLVLPTDSELSAALRASGEFEIETDKSMVRTLMVDRRLTYMGILRMTRRDGDWRFYAPFSEPGRIGYLYLQWIVGLIREVLAVEGRSTQ
jgi:hypothetical protein